MYGQSGRQSRPVRVPPGTPRRLVALFVLLCVLVLGIASSVLGAVRVKGYVSKSGTYVAPHYRSKPDGRFWNNWSTKGNVNPYTGKEGTRVTPPSSYGGYRWSPPSYSTTPKSATPSYSLPSSQQSTAYTPRYSQPYTDDTPQASYWRKAIRDEFAVDASASADLTALTRLYVTLSQDKGLRKNEEDLTSLRRSIYTQFGITAPTNATLDEVKRLREDLAALPKLVVDTSQRGVAKTARFPQTDEPSTGAKVKTWKDALAKDFNIYAVNGTESQLSDLWRRFSWSKKLEKDYGVAADPLRMSADDLRSACMRYKELIQKLKDLGMPGVPEGYSPAELAYRLWQLNTPSMSREAREWNP